MAHIYIIIHASCIFSAPIETRTTMLYEETISKLPKVSNEEIFNILEEMKEATSTGVEDRATTLFSNLVTALKTLNKADMISVIGKSQNPERYLNVSLAAFAIPLLLKSCCIIIFQTYDFRRHATNPN